MTVRAAVVVLAAGSGSRVGAASNKVLLPLAGVPVLAWSLRRLAGVRSVGRVVVVHRPGEGDLVAAALWTHAPGLEWVLVEGGPTRHASEWHALQVLADDIDTGALEVVAIHDAARPLATTELFDAVITTAQEHGGALPTRPCPGLLPTTPEAPPAGGDLVAVQTPQAFRAAPLLDAYRHAAEDGFEGTDTAACMERYTDLAVRAVPGDARNLKITYPRDLVVAERLMGDPGQPPGRPARQ